VVQIEEQLLLVHKKSHLKFIFWND